MVSPADIHGKRLAMVAWARKPDGSDDVAVFTGTAHWDGQHLAMLRGPEQSAFRVSDEWLKQIRPVEPDLKAALFGAHYFFSVTVPALPDGDDLADWPVGEGTR
jgi:hypothetical protein